MQHRRLRIAWSVACGTAAALLIALWVQASDWCLAVIAAKLAYLPWFGVWPRQFSLGTLRIITTFVAMILGLILWTAHILNAEK
jgi:hypothetical protein